jgi:hypothetical protein
MFLAGKDTQQIARRLKCSERHARRLVMKLKKVEKSSPTLPQERQIETSSTPTTTPEPLETTTVSTGIEAPVPSSPTVVARRLPKLIPIELCKPTQLELERRKQRELHDKNVEDNTRIAVETGRERVLTPATPAACARFTARKHFGSGGAFLD